MNVAENFAFNKPAIQSSTYSVNGINYMASNAVNGILYGINEYSETGGGDNQWWRVDLGSLQSIKVVEVYSRNSQRRFIQRRLPSGTISNTRMSFLLRFAFQSQI